jgi:uncharacterized protein (TIGR02246 family)
MARWLLLLVLVLFTASAQAEGEAEAEPKPAVREAVEAGNYFFRKFFDERNAGAIADLYTEDARVVAPGAEVASGRTAIAAFWAAQLEQTKSVQLETLSVESEGNLAVEEGVARLTANDGSEAAARYLVVWKRVGRRWHLHRDIWNPGPTPAAAEAAPAPAEPGPGAETEAPAPEVEPDAEQPL